MVNKMVDTVGERENGYQDGGNPELSIFLCVTVKSSLFYVNNKRNLIKFVFIMFSLKEILSVEEQSN